MVTVDRSLSLPRVLSLVGGLTLVAAFFMPWFGSQGLLLSGQFLHSFLAGANPTDLRRFLPTSSPTEVQLLRLLVDLFPTCGAFAAVAAVIAGLVHTARPLSNVVLALSGLTALLAWAIGLTRLPRARASKSACGSSASAHSLSCWGSAWHLSPNAVSLAADRRGRAQFSCEGRGARQVWPARSGSCRGG